ncbi:SAM-dependent methyltransferase [Pseudofrankia sp. BMG5.37]|nr:SAM-dependent methyltransferase [Pseudofrankia sp. BMG5.37]MDT3444379.1 SAM-dependent methyltransferase [Pseudofrankia sp. BMG5.37]
MRTDRAHSARMYDYYLGGKDNFPADRTAAEQVKAALPEVPQAAVQNRLFLVRAARFLAAEVGIRQFLDIGTGIPTSPNLHEVVQGVAPESRVVYADNDPIVLAHARALLTSNMQGRTAYVDADVREPGRILTAPELLDTLDLTRPVALSLVAILHFVSDEDGAYEVVRELVAALPAGSYLMLSSLTADYNPASVNTAVGVYHAQGLTCVARGRDAFVRFFDGLDIVEPGPTPTHLWRPDTTAPPSLEAEAGGNIIYAAVARKA